MKNKLLLSAIFLIFFVIITRLPFIFNGLGVEEDSFGLVLTLQKMVETGEYEYSRAPGHPFQEFVLMPFANSPAWVLNLFSVFFSILATLFFFFILNELQLKKKLLTTCAFALIPAVYISSVYTIDYIWALAFLLGSFYFLLKNKTLLVALFLALAVGSRVTSILLFVPIVIYFFYNFSVKEASKLTTKIGLITILVVLIQFLPALFQYGFDFIFTYKLPYPNIYKVLYKGTFGVFGIWGIVAICWATFLFLQNRKNKSDFNKNDFEKTRVVTFSILVIFLHIMLYIWVPEKSAFLLPAVPFVFILINYYLADKKGYTLIMVLFLVSPFFTSIQLADASRGSTNSPISVTKTIANQEIGFDLLYGPIISDFTKRKNKAQFVNQFLGVHQNCEKQTVVLAGFWSAQLQYDRNQLEINNQKLEILSGASKAELLQYQTNEVKIIVLPEQEKYNIPKYGFDAREFITQ